MLRIVYEKDSVETIFWVRDACDLIPGTCLGNNYSGPRLAPLGMQIYLEIYVFLVFRDSLARGAHRKTL